jgi:hypothetical protein
VKTSGSHRNAWFLPLLPWMVSFEFGPNLKRLGCGLLVIGVLLSISGCASAGRTNRDISGASAPGATSKQAGNQASEPLPVILDSDVGTDTGDFTAAALVCVAHLMKMVTLEAMTCPMAPGYLGGANGWTPTYVIPTNGTIAGVVPMDYVGGCGFFEQLCTYYGIHPEFGFGNTTNVAKSGMSYPEFAFVPFVNPGQHYGAALQSPIPVRSATNFPPAYKVMRQVLAHRRAVEIIATGQLNNVADLLRSPADEISALTGAEMVSNSVSRVVCMGGQYPSGKEYNFYTYPTAAVYAISHMPANVPIVFAGFELGQSGNPLTNRVIDLPADWLNRMATTNPVYMVFTNICGGAGRPAWDSLACLYAVCVADTNGWFSRVQGSNYVDAASGANSFTAASGPGYKDFYLTIDPANEEAVSDLLNGLIVAQPRLGARQVSSPAPLNNQFGSPSPARPTCLSRWKPARI